MRRVNSVETPWSVASLAKRLKTHIEALPAVWVEGELTQWDHRGGNVYAKLKDTSEDATIGLTIWSNVVNSSTEEFKQGDKVVVNIKPSYWLKGGTLSFNVSSIRHIGLGDLLEKLEALRKQLMSEGLFDSARKKKLPFLPNVIGLVTGKDSDAEKDVRRNAQLRWPDVRFRIEYAAVQGDESPTQVTKAMLLLDADPEVDVIIIARGGGDFQNLLGFSDEKLLRAAANLNTPLVSAIGHEADRPLLDEVADLRASTPTDAAKRVVPDVSEEIAKITQARLLILGRVSSLLSNESSVIASWRSRPALAEPTTAVTRRSEELVHLVVRGESLANTAIEHATLRTAEATSRLRALSPLATISRGYAIATKEDGKIIRSTKDIKTGEALNITVSDGKIAAKAE
ncbi:MAG: exodeoxyribonuclease VII large subunit [Microbacteriaceae bacterium]|nr:exodeoxyribonuclease VII large subunit [Microbacteriaceae bacterium]